MVEVKERNFAQDDNGKQFLVISISKIGRTMVMELLSAEDGSFITVFSPPRIFEEISQLGVGSSTNMNLERISYDTSKLLRPFLT